MKLRNKLAAITAAAMLAFTGVGFGAWVFGHQATENATVTNVVTAAVDLTGLTADHDSFKLVLDQPSKSYNLQGKGLHWEDNSGNALTSIELTPAITFRSGSDTPTYEYSFVPDVTISSGFDSIVTFSNVDETERTGTFTQASPLAAFSYTLPTLAYTDEPESLAEYDAMVTALAGKSISFSFTLNITDNVAQLGVNL